MPVKSDWRAPWRRQCGRSCSARSGGPPARLEADRQPGWAEHVRALARLARIGAGQPEALQAHEEIGEGDPALQARNMSQTGPYRELNASGSLSTRFTPS